MEPKPPGTPAQQATTMASHLNRSLITRGIKPVIWGSCTPVRLYHLGELIQIIKNNQGPSNIMYSIHIAHILGKNH